MISRNRHSVGVTRSAGHSAPARPDGGRSGVVVDRGALASATLFLAILAVPRLPTGVCFGDSGDLQVASATLGIAHPPGYAGQVSAGYLLSLLPGVSPAFAVTLGCLATALAALGFGMLIQVRLGTNIWIAGALAVLLAGHPRMWVNLIVPEVYAPTLALEVAAAYLILEYVGRQRSVTIFAAALLIGLAMANRPPIIVAIPVFALALWRVWRRYGLAMRRRLRHASLALIALVLPCLYSFAYVCVRDTRATPWNYIERYDAELGVLSPSDAGISARLERAIWLTSGAQYRDLLDFAGTDAAGRLRDLVSQLALENDVVFVSLACFGTIGVALAIRRCQAVALVLIALALSAAVFFCVYRVFSTEADILPVLLVTTIFVGVGVSPLLPAQGGWGRRAVAMALFAVACAWTAWRAPRQSDAAREADATAYVAAAQLQTLPRDSVILAGWRVAPALCYGACVEAKRADILVASAQPDRWVGLAGTYAIGTDGRRRPVFLADKPPRQEGLLLVPHGNLWRLETSRPNAQSSSGVGHSNHLPVRVPQR